MINHPLHQRTTQATAIEQLQPQAMEAETLFHFRNQQHNQHGEVVTRLPPHNPNEENYEQETDP